MKVPTLMLLVSLGLLAVMSVQANPVDDLLADEDAEIVSMDDAIRKAQLIRNMLKLLAEEEAKEEGSNLHKRSAVGDFFKKLGDKIKKAAHKVADFFEGVYEKAKKLFKKITHTAEVDFEEAMKYLIPMIDTNTTEGECRKICVKESSSLKIDDFDADTLCEPLCDGALAKIQKLATEVVIDHQSATSVFKEMYASAKAEFEKLTSKITFDSVVNKLIPLIDSSTSVSECEKVCDAGADKLGLAIVDGLCTPVCKGALAELQRLAKEELEKKQ